MRRRRGDLTLWHYGSNTNTYLMGSFPLKVSLVCLVAAAVPLLVALVMFRTKAYEGNLVAVWML